MNWLTTVREGVRSRLWPLPVVGVVGAMLAAVALPYLDLRAAAALPPWLSAMLFGGDAGAARTLLDAISSSLITVTALTFSLTVVTLQLASTQFTPRLLRTFTGDVFVQATLGICLATFTYSLTLLRVVRSADEGAAFVPRLSISVAFLLALLSVVGLVLFLAHLAREIRVETLMRDVHDEATVTIERATAPIDEDTTSATPALTPPAKAHRLFASKSGFVTKIDGPALLLVAVDNNVRIAMDCHPGSNVIEGVPIGSVWSTAGPISPEADARVRRAVRAALTVGYERTSAHDVGYGLRQLLDVAAKALSPGINDPTTAIHAIGHISAVLCRLAHRDLRPLLLRDDDTELRVILQRPSFVDFLEEALSELGHYGASDPHIMKRLFRLLEELSWHVGDPAVLTDQLDRLELMAHSADNDAAARTKLECAADRVRRALAR